MAMIQDLPASVAIFEVWRLSGRRWRNGLPLTRRVAICFSVAIVIATVMTVTSKVFKIDVALNRRVPLHSRQFRTEHGDMRGGVMEDISVDDPPPEIHVPPVHFRGHEFIRLNTQPVRGDSSFRRNNEMRWRGTAVRIREIKIARHRPIQNIHIQDVCHVSGGCSSSIFESGREFPESDVVCSIGGSDFFKFGTIQYKRALYRNQGFSIYPVGFCYQSGLLLASLSTPVHSSTLRFHFDRSAYHRINVGIRIVNGYLGGLRSGIGTLLGKANIAEHQNVGYETRSKQQAGEYYEEFIKSKLFAIVLFLLSFILCMFSFYLACLAINNKGRINVWKLTLALITFFAAHIPGYFGLIAFGM